MLETDEELNALATGKDFFRFDILRTCQHKRWSLLIWLIKEQIRIPFAEKLFPEIVCLIAKKYNFKTSMRFKPRLNCVLFTTLSILLMFDAHRYNASHFMQKNAFGSFFLYSFQKLYHHKKAWHQQQAKGMIGYHPKKTMKVKMKRMMTLIDGLKTWQG